MRFLLMLSALVPLSVASLTSAQELPAVGIHSPVQGSTIAGPDVTVEVVVTDFTLIPPTGADENPGEGHIIYYLDVEPVFIPGQSAIPSDPDAIYAASDQLMQTFQDVAPGPHDVTVLLVHDNHVPVFPPPAIDQVSFVVTAPAETPTPDSTAPASPEPTPRVAEEARTEEPEQQAPGQTPAGSPTPAVLAAQLPAVGDAPAAPNGGLSSSLLVGVAVAVVALVGGVTVAQRVRRGR